jgi:hypothetical protein
MVKVLYNKPIFVRVMPSTVAADEKAQQLPTSMEDTYILNN